jgi:hypothetical protein
MTVDYQDLEGLLERIKLLPPEYRLRLMQGILDTLVPTRPAVPTGILKFGEYQHFDGPMSTPEDYAVAEWRPTDRELNGE